MTSITLRKLPDLEDSASGETSITPASFTYLIYLQGTHTLDQPVTSIFSLITAGKLYFLTPYI